MGWTLRKKSVVSGKEKNSLHIKDWPEGDRPREMLLEKGPEALSDAALLAILLRTGRQGQNAIALVREMINKFRGAGMDRQGIYYE